MTREEATDALANFKRYISGGGVVDVKANEAIDMAIEALTNVQNTHKGKWIKKQVFNPGLDKYVPFIKCSVCGYGPYYGGSEYKLNYCANCGADNRGDKNE